jgi:hypothetical protein
LVVRLDALDREIDLFGKDKGVPGLCEILKSLADNADELVRLAGGEDCPKELEEPLDCNLDLFRTVAEKTERKAGYGLHEAKIGSGRNRKKEIGRKIHDDVA